MTRAAERRQEAGACEPVVMNHPQPDANSWQPKAADTWTADASYPADSPVPYALTAKAQTLLEQTGSPTLLLQNEHARGMRASPPQVRPGTSGPAHAYITEICVPPGTGIHSIHARMNEPEPEPEGGQ